MHTLRDAWQHRGLCDGCLGNSLYDCIFATASSTFSSAPPQPRPRTELREPLHVPSHVRSGHMTPSTEEAPESQTRFVIGSTTLSAPPQLNTCTSFVCYKRLSARITRTTFLLLIHHPSKSLVSDTAETIKDVYQANHTSWNVSKLSAIP
ncbi:unnamed protein product [Protopolystoma xenopodis]|uniref:Uncharacterized protein n=1 Tax=Protopolystoma xenopodis TaxID=117903 RepID=A0A448WWP6_9PLAT|nr:unnamed protein product [Protopolystoma xenopodis]